MLAGQIEIGFQQNSWNNFCLDSEEISKTNINFQKSFSRPKCSFGYVISVFKKRTKIFFSSETFFRKSWFCFKCSSGCLRISFDKTSKKILSQLSEDENYKFLDCFKNSLKMFLWTRGNLEITFENTSFCLKLYLMI